MSSPLEQRIDAAQQDLAALHRHLKSSNRITAIGGLIVLALLTGYFSFGYSKIKGVSNPDVLVKASIQMLNDELPRVRKQLEAKIEELAPVWAEQLSEKIIGSAPMLRETLEDFALKRTGMMVENLRTMSEKEFRTVLAENGPIINQAIEELAENEEVSDATLNELTAALEREMKADLQEDAEQLLFTLVALNDKLDKLSVGLDLDEEENIERRTIMIIRRLQSEQGESEVTDLLRDGIFKDFLPGDEPTDSADDDDDSDDDDSDDDDSDDDDSDDDDSDDDDSDDDSDAPEDDS